MNGLTKSSLSVAHPVVRPIRGGLSRPLAARNRKAFTLVEVLMVIGIIAILAAMATYGVNNALNASRRASTKQEMAQIEIALANATRELGDIHTIPSIIALHEDIRRYANNDPSYRQLKMMFSGITNDPTNEPNGKWLVDWNGDNSISNDPNPIILKGDQAWVFFVGGIPRASGPDGFSRDSNPALLSDKKKGPYFDFKQHRLVKKNGFYSYLDYWEKNVYLVYNNYSKSPTAEELCFDSPIPDTFLTPSLGKTPYRYYLSLSPAKLHNPKTYQIISAGKDGIFGTKLSGYSNFRFDESSGSFVYQPSGSAPPRPIVFNGYGDGDTTGGADDQANFSDSPLAKPID